MTRTSYILHCTGLLVAVLTPRSVRRRAGDFIPMDFSVNERRTKAGRLIFARGDNLRRALQAYAVGVGSVKKIGLIHKIPTTTLRRYIKMNNVKKGACEPGARLRKLRTWQVVEIRESGASTRSLASKYGVSFGAVWDVRNNVTWRCLL